MHCNQDKVGVQQPGLQFTLNRFINVLMLSVPQTSRTFRWMTHSLWRETLDYDGNF